MDYKISRLRNNLRILTVSMPSLESAALSFWVRVGSRFENKSQQGISHFLEHIAFKGGVKYKTPQIVSETLDGMGAKFNAATSKDWTTYYIKVRSEKLEKAFDVLSDMLLQPTLPEKEIEKERGVIIQEIAMNEDNPQDKVSNLFYNLIFDGKPLGRDIAGTKETVSKISKTDIQSYLKNHYVSDNAILTVSGGINDKNTVYLAEKYFGKLKKAGKTSFEKFKVTQKKKREEVVKKDIEQTNMIVGYYGYQREHPKWYAMSLLATVVGGGMSSRMFREIRERRGLAYAVGTSLDSYYDTGIFATFAAIEPKNKEKVIDLIVNEYKKILTNKGKVTSKELKKAKELVKGRTAISLEDTLAVNSFFAKRAMFMKDILTPEQVFEKIDAVDLDELQKVAKELFVEKYLNIASVEPKK